MSNPNLAAYYTLGDMVFASSGVDSSGNGQTGSTFTINATPSFGATGPFLHDPTTALDCSGGTNSPGGGFQTIDTSALPPITYQPLSTAGSVWAMDIWFQYTGSALPDGTSIPNFVLLHWNSNYPGTTEIELGQNGAFIGSSPAGGRGLGFILNNYYASLFGQIASNFQNASLFDGNWHYVAYNNIDGNFANQSVIYIDETPTLLGTGFSSRGAPTNITAGAAPSGTSLITYTTSGSNPPCTPFPGLISNFALYSASLSQAQIANHYAIGTIFKHAETATAGVSPRLTSLLATMGLPSSTINAPYPFRTVLYPETNLVTTTSVLNYLQTMTESEPGLIFQGPDGRINTYSRQYQYLNPSTITSQGIFGDSTSASLHYDGPSFGLVEDDLDTWNTVQVQSGRSGALNTIGAPVGGSSGATLQQATSPQSASVYGPRTLQGLTSLQMEYDSDALAIAQQYLDWYQNPLNRVALLMTDNYGALGQNIPQILQRGLYDRITVQYQGQTPGAVFSQDALIEQITHTVNMESGPIWTWQIALSPYEILQNAMIFNNWTFGTVASVAVMTL